MTIKKVCDSCGFEETEKVRLQAYSKSTGDRFDLCPACKSEFEVYLNIFRPDIERTILALERIRDKLFDSWLDWRVILTAHVEEVEESE